MLHTAVDGEPFVDRAETAVCTVPTDTPEGDGTPAWDSTTMIVVQVSGGGATGLGYTYGAAAAAQVVERQLADVVTGRCVWDVAGAADVEKGAAVPSPCPPTWPPPPGPRRSA
ncbi:hypothetical protein [Streptomyces rhizosphaerihabitans]|uniref:hypothetical protein n=1 Tax=Streptomyces rhizosphaerihabitans TaxID=1266770 RepID=UPI0028F6CE88|nr:hypothetical protein [Streptomyces rhizosphaerihabitans]